MKLSFARPMCQDPNAALGREWLETNGLGGYASSTIWDCHTRKYHGLLVLPLAQPRGRYVLLSKVDASIGLEGGTVSLATNRFPGVFHPTGYEHIASFASDPCPRTDFHLGRVHVRRRVLMPYRRNTVILKYERLDTDGPVRLFLEPLIAFRDFHGLTAANPALQGEVCQNGELSIIEPYPGMPSLYLDGSRALSFQRQPEWVYRVEFQRERERGFDYHEDLFRPGVIAVDLVRGEPFFLRAGIEAANVPAATLWRREIRRRRALAIHCQRDPAPLQTLKRQAQNFLVRNEQGEASVVAGYHWFGEWGRDSMIALPGLTFACGRLEEGLEVLETFARHERNGLIPNYFNPGSQEHAYNSTDGALWFFWAVQEYLAAGGDEGRFKRLLFPVCARIVEAFLQGRTPDAQVRADGLLDVGNAHTQLTWMDAQVNGQPVTPRHGLAVELNALWFNALSFYLDYGAKFGLLVDRRAVAARASVKRAFGPTFWLPDANYLADVVGANGVDAALRPNQLFAVSLPYSPLSKQRMRGVVKAAKEQLATPYGLRTLAPSDPAYKGGYGGTSEARDGAYHQGTVWPWLVGHFAAACLRVAEDRQREKEYLRTTFEPLFNAHLAENGLGGISEIFDGDPPHRGNGCISQAWSVAEAIRTMAMLQEVEER